MGKLGNVKVKGLEEFQKNLAKLQKPEDFVESCAKELAARLLAKVIKRTPVRDYSKEVTVTAQRNGKKHKKGEQYTKRVNTSGKQGGTLRRGWISESQTEAESGKGSPNKDEILNYVNRLKADCSDGKLKITIANPVEYASYVESGHRQRKKKGFRWVEGHLMMKKSV